MPTLKPIYWIAATALLLVTLFYMQKCTRTNRVDNHRGNIAAILNADSLRSAEAAKWRKSVDSLSLELEQAIADKDTVYLQAKAKATRLEIVYRDKPTLQSCDSALRAKNVQIGILENKDSLKTLLLAIKDTTIAGLDRLMADKNISIAHLSQDYTRAVNQLEKLSSKRIVVSGGVGYGMAIDGKPQPYAGVQVGFKLFEF